MPVQVKDGKLQGKVGDKTMEQGKNTNTAETLNNFSATGANLKLPPYIKKNLDSHFGSGENSDHSGDYPDFTKP